LTEEIKMQSLYDIDDVRYMWKELENIGFTPLHTPKEVDKAINNINGTTLVVINSVCGCAAGHARPGVGLALQHNIIPDNLVTVFAGVDREAVARAREFLPGFPPSSPSVALFKNGQPVFMLHRSAIETADAEGVARKLIAAFESHCEAPGPSVPREVFENNFKAPQCSSTLSKNPNG
jgi:putative YphP/YqiW family bacilliredoxin